MKKMMRRVFRFLKVKRRVQKINSKPICYSAAGYLTDLLEQSGFCVDSIKRYGNRYAIEVLIVDEVEKLVVRRLKNNMRKTAVT